MSIDLSLEEDRVFKVIGKAAQEMKMPAYAIGGFVRDKILGRPSNDIDVMCVGSGIELAREVAATFSPPMKVAIFKNFGTAKLQPSSKHKDFKDFDIEFVGARKESYRKDSRNPVVEDGSFQDDLDRRDFTINTLAIDLNSGGFNEVLDTFNGVKDLNDRIIRTPKDPNVAFIDDPLRMLRAIRFAATLDFTIEQKTFDSIKENKERIEIVSQERITDEVNKILSSNVPSQGFLLLFESGLLDIILPELSALRGVERVNNISHKDNFYHTLKVVDNISDKSTDLWLRWAALLHDIAKPRTKRFDEKLGWTFHGHEIIGSHMVTKIFKRMKLPLNEHMKLVKKLVHLHLRPISLTDDNTTDSGIRRLLFDGGDDIEKLLLLCEADITSKDKTKIDKYLKNFEKVRKQLKEVEEKDRIRNWQPPISGKMIMKIFDIPPSEKIGYLKNAIKNAILDGDIENSYDEALKLLLEKAKELGLKKNK